MAGTIHVLDVREMLRAKQEPFQVIMSTVAGVGPEDIFELHATFRPDPLIRVLGKQGFHAAVVQEAEDHFIVQFYKEETEVPVFHLDNRGLEPPQPMVRTLEFLDGHDAVQSGELALEIWNERVPAFLLPELEERGFTYEIDDEGNGTVRVRIRKAS
ncbi:DUF2249 domain-containing protein [Alicyclobacillus sp.]|uniref:DUF2249 domain-containing protein n=1 Tax=Alicyclobacillus sp. TaxID=61169 RepID=UPI0025BB0D77|nr:DUF2249 domain-containing protein [Alicyclobacillus sp.]MCL6517207.1 DUF2249 domain-containing protein [Alicyclobacillus sp.]